MVEIPSIWVSGLCFSVFSLGLSIVKSRSRRSSLGVLFDLDGTLLDFEGASHQALNAPIQQRFPHLAVDWSLHAKIVGKPNEAWSRQILEELDISHDLLSPEEYAHEWHEHIQNFFPSMTLLPGALQLVERIKREHPEIKLAIATSSVKENFTLKMAFHPELVQHFDVIVTGNEVQFGKPSPDIFILAAQRIGVSPQRCVVFEDSPSGILAAKRAGCFAVGIPDPRMEGNESLFDIADQQLTSLEEIKDLGALWEILRIRT